MKPWRAMDDKKRYLRWSEEMREIHNAISREEERKEEVLEIFQALRKLAQRRVEAPSFPRWEPHW